jgi:hypothetical protein
VELCSVQHGRYFLFILLLCCRILLQHSRCTWYGQVKAMENENEEEERKRIYEKGMMKEKKD